MDKFEILKAKAKELGLSAEDVVRCFWRDKELSHEFLQNLLYGVELRKAERGDIKKSRCFTMLKMRLFPKS